MFDNEENGLQSWLYRPLEGADAVEFAERWRCVVWAHVGYWGPMDVEAARLALQVGRPCVVRFPPHWSADRAELAYHYACTVEDDAHVVAEDEAGYRRALGVLLSLVSQRGCSASSERSGFVLRVFGAGTSWSVSLRRSGSYSEGWTYAHDALFAPEDPGCDRPGDRVLP